ncbi:V-type immunoglobulin domain-containing suppressor of T-cell activation [Megalops cyprinoides]|uniref:V-type immunoglobulin domain-containing suppressor of T-cell activation n=1 Tax=Megalops cyprinoides TaxID=118141 RepID=UPI001864B383|nr:V-type immunoglobulin domain-containing suppressor of T-cell activation [Megalops cyprinoides]
MSDSYRRLTAGLHLTPALRLYFHLFVIIGAVGEAAHYQPTMVVSVPHMSYFCPQGINVSLPCNVEGAPLHHEDHLQHGWIFTPHQDERCHDKVHPRQHGNHSHASSVGVQYGTSKGYFWVTLLNVTHADQGRYCCVLLEYEKDKNHPKLVQRTHNHVLLTVVPRRNGSDHCTYWDHKAPEGSVAAGLATAGCIMGILSLPLILLLVYKQRQTAQSNRRAHELVRMDSEMQGHENPVFLGGSPQTKTRTVSQIMTRQSSETGRHLLSEPGTPLSPPAHGEVFFPSHEPIPESPDFMQV